MEKVRTLELFCGYGTASFAVKMLGLPYDLIGYSDIDKWANQCFKQNHCPWDIDDKLRLGDATKIDPYKLRDFDLLTGGFPCQAFSVAGKGLGELDTRGSLFHEIIRIAEVKHPRFMMLENVKGLISKKHKPTFNKIISELYRIGYFVKWQVLNTKEHGIPQNRERIFFACFNMWEDFCKFRFPEKEELKLRLKDILEHDVEEKYYLNEKQVKRLLESTDLAKKFSTIDADVAGCMTARQYANWKGNHVTEKPVSSFRSRNLIKGDTSPTLAANPGGSKPYVLATKLSNMNMQGRRVKDLDDPSFTLGTGSGCENGVTIIQRPHGDNKGGERAKDGVAPTLTAGASWENNNLLSDYVRIRKLTPTECFRLQGFLNDEVNLDELSNTQRYKLAWNGQSVNVVKKILSNMLGVEDEKNFI